MKVSVITIVYNNNENIVHCIESILNQTYFDIEHILIDGGSTDGTQEKIKPYLDRIAYYISERDTGLYNALNKGIKQATGDVIGVLHSDDMYYESTSIQKIVDTFHISGTDLVYANGVYVEKQNTDKVKRVYASKPFKKKYINFGWIPLHTTIYVKKEVFDKYGYYNENYSIASDYDISLRWFTCLEIKKVFLNEWVVKMRLGGKSTIIRLQKKKSMEDLEIINHFKLLGWFTLIFKILRKVPQYVIARIIKFNF